MRTCCGILVLKLLALTANEVVWAWPVTSMASDLSTFGSCLSAMSFLKLYLSLRTRSQAQISWLRHYTKDVPSPCRQSCDKGLNCCSLGRRHISPKEFNPALGTAMPTSHIPSEGMQWYLLLLLSHLLRAYSWTSVYCCSSQSSNFQCFDRLHLWKFTFLFFKCYWL